MGLDQSPHTPDRQSAHGDDEENANQSTRCCAMAPALEHRDQSNPKQQDGADG